MTNVKKFLKTESNILIIARIYFLTQLSRKQWNEKKESNREMKLLPKYFRPLRKITNQFRQDGVEADVQITYNWRTRNRSRLKGESCKVGVLERSQLDLGWLVDAHRLLRFRTIDALSSIKMQEASTSWHARFKCTHAITRRSIEHVDEFIRFELSKIMEYGIRGQNENSCGKNDEIEIGPIFNRSSFHTKEFQKN